MHYVLLKSQLQGFCIGSKQGDFGLFSGMHVFVAVTLSLMNTDRQQLLFKQCLSFRKFSGEIINPIISGNWAAPRQ